LKKFVRILGDYLNVATKNIDEKPLKDHCLEKSYIRTKNKIWSKKHFHT